jgi:hypothetical protein
VIIFDVGRTMSAAERGPTRFSIGKEAVEMFVQQKVRENEEHSNPRFLVHPLPLFTAPTNFRTSTQLYARSKDSTALVLLGSGGVFGVGAP